MTEAQPSGLNPGATGDIANDLAAEDRKAASALASLDSHEDTSTPPPSKNVNQDAVNAAISNLSSGEGVAKKSAAAPTANKSDAAVPKKAVKIDQTDVAFLVKETELTKAKVTEMLRAADGNLDEALKVFITPSF